MQGKTIYSKYGYNNPYPDYYGDKDNRQWRIISKRKSRRKMKREFIKEILNIVG